MSIIRVRIDGELQEIREGTTVGEALPTRDQRCSIAVIRPVARELARTSSYRVFSSRGELVIELIANASEIFGASIISQPYPLQWSDRYASAFGPFSSNILPDRKAHLYNRGDVILGCGGYDPKRSYLIFSKMHHSADFGAAADGGIIGRVVSGRGVLDRWTTGDEITGFEQVISWADKSRSFTTMDKGFVLEDDMEIVTHATIGVQGFSDEGIETSTAESVEHLLLALEKGVFKVDRSSSTHIADFGLNETDVPEELRLPRREGSVTLRTRGKNRGSVYIYTEDLPASAAHTIVGQVTHGIELARLAREGDVFCVSIRPSRFDLIGNMLSTAEGIAASRGVELSVDAPGADRIVVDQVPRTTLECLSAGKAGLTTVPLAQVIDIFLDDKNAPASCDIFRKLTGLNLHHVGRLPFFFHFEDVFLFKPVIPKWVSIIPENTPAAVVPALTLALTNDSRRGAGLVGVRVTDNSEFGPTSEPFEGTNIIGKVLQPEKLGGFKGNQTVYIREVAG
jgi:putative methanogenesis marker protein 3